MKNKVFMFLIVFSLMVGFLGSVYALNYYPSGSYPSAKSVPTVLKISGNLNLNTTCTDCNLVVSVLNKDDYIYNVVKNIHATDAQTIINDLNSGIFTNPFGYIETGHVSSTISVKVDVLNAGSSLVSTSVDLQNPSYNKGFLIADTVAYGGITRSELHDQSVGWIALDTNNIPWGPGAVLSYDSSKGQLIWNDFLSMITDGSITTAKLADNSVIGSKVAPGSLDESDVVMRTYLKLNPQQSAPVTCDASTVGLMYILRTDNIDNPSTYSDKICVYDSGTTTYDTYYCWDYSTNVCDNPTINCDPCIQGQNNCSSFTCRTTTGAGYQWMDVN